MLVRRHGNPRPPSRGRRPRRLLPSPSFSCVGTGIHAPAADDRLRRRPPSVILVRRHGNPRPRRTDDRLRHHPPFRHSRAQTRESMPPAARTTAHDAVPPLPSMLVRRYGNPRPRRADDRPRRRPPSVTLVRRHGNHAPAARTTAYDAVPPFRHSRAQTREPMPPPRGRPPTTPCPLPSFSCADTGTRMTEGGDGVVGGRPRGGGVAPAHDAVPPSVILVRRHGNPRPRRADAHG